MNTFKGFSQETSQFLIGLALNNHQAWYEEHKSEYRQYLVEPALAFIREMGERLSLLSPRIKADTRTNGAGSLFRLRRDTRFSGDKSPFKTHLGIFFWEGRGVKMESSGFYFHLEPPKISLFAGVYQFTRPMLQAYREAVTDSEWLARLESISAGLHSQGYQVGGRHYKRLPRGYEEFEGNSFLLFNTLYAELTTDIPPEVYSASLLDYCFEHFSAMHPLHRWVVDLEGWPGI